MQPCCDASSRHVDKPPLRKRSSNTASPQREKFGKDDAGWVAIGDTLSLDKNYASLIRTMPGI
jgi:hypothetical protein